MWVEKKVIYYENDEQTKLVGVGMTRGKNPGQEHVYHIGMIL